MNVCFVNLEVEGVGCGKIALFTPVGFDLLLMYAFHVSQHVSLVTCLVFTIPTVVLQRLS